MLFLLFCVFVGVMFTCLSRQSLQWRHNERDCVSNHQPHDCLLNCLFRRGLKKTSKLRVTGHCVGNSPVTGELPAHRASNAEKVSIWWRHHILHFVWSLFWVIISNTWVAKISDLCVLISKHYFSARASAIFMFTYHVLNIQFKKYQCKKIGKK